MSDPREKLEEYVDGLLDEEQCREVEAVLARDPALRGELENVRRFGELLEQVHDVRAEERAVQRILVEVNPPRRGLFVLLAGGAVAAAADLEELKVWLLKNCAVPVKDISRQTKQRGDKPLARRVIKKETVVGRHPPSSRVSPFAG